MPGQPGRKCPTRAFRSLDDVYHGLERLATRGGNGGVRRYPLSTAALDALVGESRAGGHLAETTPTGVPNWAYLVDASTRQLLARRARRTIRPGLWRYCAAHGVNRSPTRRPGRPWWPQSGG